MVLIFGRITMDLTSKLPGYKMRLIVYSNAQTMMQPETSFLFQQ